MTEKLLKRLRGMAPWHMDIALGPDVHTVDGNSEASRGMPLIRPAELRPLLKRLYPQGIGGKRFLDCACNAGGYSLLASDLGASSFGFDVREHWIEQARFLKRHFGKSDDQVRFEVCDLLEADALLGSERFDICLFKGIFYHLPDPVAGLKIVADRTDEVLILDTESAVGLEDGCLKLVWETVTHTMSGVHGLAWFPTGPEVLLRILEWLGFEATRVLYCREPPPSSKKVSGRMRVVGARNAALLADLATPRTPSMLVPKDGDVLSGTVALSTRAPDEILDIARVEFHATGAKTDAPLGAGTLTDYGWICMWDTTTVRNGTYTVGSSSFDRLGIASPRANVNVTVRN